MLSRGLAVSANDVEGDSRVNRARRVFWCRQKLSWKPGDWKSVVFSDETQVVIGQARKV